MEAKKTRNQIIELLDEHKGTYGDCPGCSICKRIEKLRKQLVRESTEKFKHILDKGQDMTKSEIAFLIDNDVQKKTIRSALKMSAEDFFAMLVNFGLSKRRETEEVAKITVEQYRDLKAQGMTDKEVSEKTGIPIATLSYHKKKWKKNERKSTVQADTVAERQTDIKTAPNENEAKLQAMVNDLGDELNVRKSRIKELEEKVAELKHINAACDDVENETANLKDEISKLVDLRYRDSYDIENMQRNIENLDKTLQRYEKENKALRELIALWI